MGNHDEVSKGDAVPSEPPPPYSPSADPVNQSPAWGHPQARPSNASRPQLPARPPVTSPSEQLTPTEVPTPGRPLLREGKFLVYKPGSFCHKCGNTGYKDDDPYHPCKNCWRKYSRPYTSAVAHSWPTVDQQHNPATTSQAQNYQRPLVLTHFRPTPAAMYTSPQPVTLNQSSTRPGLIERGGQQNRVPRQGWAASAAPLQGPLPGQYVPSPPPPPPLPPPISPNVYQNGYPMQPEPLRVLPGDPRIGGLPCHYCRSVGTIPIMFGLDTDICPVCRGVGRVFP
ncbi:hypothetical protein NliqN6_0279 [Naganishia liquefaciens]|uniref:Uncharacterized protein n=1 Tax=Naganishia liquefaciens TaxID=104408 RepID=A0A8H3YD31_9TREE|nr:hypothetical protein NliqN6_0279 [Naganishia liquefaciens]